MGLGILDVCKIQLYFTPFSLGVYKIPHCFNLIVYHGGTIVHDKRFESLHIVVKKKSFAIINHKSNTRLLSKNKIISMLQ